MKKNLLIILFATFLFSTSSAQWLPLVPIETFNYNSSAAKTKQLLVRDSLLYAIRSGGLEILDTNNQTINYRWANHYDMKKIVADTGNNYIYLKNQKYIERYNYTSQQYESINNGTINNSLIQDIDISPDGRVWAVTSGNKLGIYDGVNWQIFTYALSGFTDIKTLNDTMAYIKRGSQFLRFHQGVFDSLYIIPMGYNYKDWDVDPSGNLWVAANNKLIKVAASNVTEFDSTNTPLGYEKFLHVKAGSDGHIWTAGLYAKLLEFDGATWIVKTIANVSLENFTLDEQNHPWVVTGSVYYLSSNLAVYIYDGNIWKKISFPFIPLKSIKAASNSDIDHFNNYFLLATDEGLFSISANNFLTIGNFNDSAAHPFANDITCFVDNEGFSSNPTFGSHHGLNSSQGFNNALLPNDTVLHICYENGTYYVGTDSGLVLYNGTVYTFFNTSNSPLPSDKITFVAVGNNFSSPNNLYVGTDRGLAIYKNGQWTVYDTSNIPLSNFYVTGILPYENINFGDTATYITTLGNGLIKLFPSGSYELLNTSNGMLLDDSLFYVKYLELAECGQFIIAGTKKHGIAFRELFSGNIFSYDTLSNFNLPIHSSEFISQSSWYGSIIITDSNLFFVSPCSAIEENIHHSSLGLKWHQEGNQLIIFIPENFSGTGNVLLTDVLGKTLVENRSEIKSSGKIKMNVNYISPGIYFLRITLKDKVGIAKVIISSY